MISPVDARVLGPTPQGYVRFVLSNYESIELELALGRALTIDRVV